MEITVHLPDDIAQHADPAREALEAFVIEGYKSEVLSQHQAAALLGMGRLEFEGFLKERGVMEHAYDIDQLEEDLQSLAKLGLFHRNVA
jgi:predicted HTH domain antitoxin